MAGFRSGKVNDGRGRATESILAPFYSELATVLAVNRHPPMVMDGCNVRSVVFSAVGQGGKFRYEQGLVGHFRFINAGRAIPVLFAQ